MGIPPEKIINVHGTLGKIVCEDCNSEYPMDQFLIQLQKNIKDIYGIDLEAPKESKNINCLKCGKPRVKPATVLYGSSLPNDFFVFSGQDFPHHVDLLLVIGTSLTVSPANMLVVGVSDDCKRVIINMEKVGESLGIDYSPNAERDYFLSGTCSEGVTKLVEALGWTEDFNTILPEHLK